MSIKYNGNSPEVAIPTPGSPAIDKTILELTYACTATEAERFTPAEPEAAVQCANMRAWLAGVALLTIIAETIADEDRGAGMGTKTVARMTYRTHTGKTVEWETVLPYHVQKQGTHVRAWWALRKMIGEMLKSRFGCCRCGGSGVTKSAGRVGHSRMLIAGTVGTCFRCWGRLTDPVVLEHIATGGNPVAAEVQRPVLPFEIQ